MSLVLTVAVALLVVGAVAGPAAAADKSSPRCCVKLPLTGMPLYVPVLASIGLIGAGVALRRRTREF